VTAVQFGVHTSDISRYLFETVRRERAIRAFGLVVEVFQEAAHSAEFGQDTEVGFRGYALAKTAAAHKGGQGKAADVGLGREKIPLRFREPDRDFYPAPFVNDFGHCDCRLPICVCVSSSILWPVFGAVDNFAGFQNLGIKVCSKAAAGI
jgi:hypothetical protein